MLVEDSGLRDWPQKSRNGNRHANQLVCGSDSGCAGLMVLTEVAPRKVSMLDLTVAWMKADIRHVPGTSFDLAIRRFDSLQAFDSEGLRLVLGSARRTQRKGGRFAFDIYQPNRSALAVATRTRVVLVRIQTAMVSA